MSDNALAWLRAQLDDDERVAREALGDSWLAVVVHDLAAFSQVRGDALIAPLLRTT